MKITEYDMIQLKAKIILQLISTGMNTTIVMNEADNIISWVLTGYIK